MKPPGKVYIGNHLPFIACSTSKSSLTPHGPYVHMDAFIRLADHRAQEVSEEGLSYAEAFVNAAMDLAKELKES